MATVLRLLTYVAGGGALLACLSPRNTVAEVVMILAWLGLCAAVDGAVEAARGRSKQGIRRDHLPSSRRERTGWFRGLEAFHSEGAGRRSMRLLCTAADLDEAEVLLARLRERKLHPMLLTQQRSGTVGYEICLAETEWARGNSVLARVSSRKVKS